MKFMNVRECLACLTASEDEEMNLWENDSLERSFESILKINMVEAIYDSISDDHDTFALPSSGSSNRICDAFHATEETQLVVSNSLNHRMIDSADINLLNISRWIDRLSSEEIARLTTLIS